MMLESARKGNLDTSRVVALKGYEPAGLIKMARCLQGD